MRSDADDDNVEVEGTPGGASPTTRADEAAWDGVTVKAEGDEKDLTSVIDAAKATRTATARRDAGMVRSFVLLLPIQSRFRK